MPKSSRACLSCRARKIKCDCDASFPCSNCRKHGIQCTLANDNRSCRPAAGYIRSLEQRLARAEEALHQLSGGGFDEPITIDGESSISTDSKHPRPSAFQNLYDAESASVYGPTSIFNCIPIRSNRKDITSLSKLNKDPVVIESIKLFFNWLYPDIHMFIPREAFLLDFFHPKEGVDSYCSTELVYSLCSLGSSVSQDTSISNRSFFFYKAARSSLLEDLDHPSIASLQSFIMLGLYDIYNGRNNSGWVLSGIGLRMGFNLGFQLNPKSWYLKEESINDLTVSIRSRIYWGCFIVDHLLGLLLGRPATLQISDTTIQESEATPDIDWIAEYNFPGYDKIIDISNPLKNVVQLIVLTEDILHRVFFKNDPNLDTYNRQIIDWREKLPDPLKWDRKTLGRRASDPTRMMLVYYYYVVQLCLNRQFVRISGNSSQEICHNAIEDLYVAITSFTKVHGFQKCSILIVYASIISVSVILLSASEKATSNDVALSLHFNPETRRNFFAFMNVLKECSNTWKLSQRSFEMICQKLKKDYRLDYEKEYERQTSEITGIGKAPSYDSPGLKSQHSDIQYNSFGGPPLFVSADFDWESLFPGCKDENE